MTDPHGVAYDPHVFFTLMKRLHVHACDDWPGASAAVFKKSRSSASQAPLLCGGESFQGGDTSAAFAAILQDGRIVAWRDAKHGGDSS